MLQREKLGFVRCCWRMYYLNAHIEFMRAHFFVKSVELYAARKFKLSDISP